MSLDAQLAQLLNDLLATQGEFLQLLGRKRELLIANDAAGLAAQSPAEEQLLERLQACVRRREELIREANESGIRASNLQALTASLPRDQRSKLDPDLRQALAQSRVLRHQGLVNWVVVQRTLLHLSQLIEIIATGGRMQPTYGKGEPVASTGGLVDRAA